MDIWKRQQLLFTDSEQEKIRDMVVLIAGIGGLGSHQAQELQRIGIKKVYIFDYDQIEPTNLNRQIFYGRDDINKCKTVRAKKFLESFDLETEIIAQGEKITEETEIPADVDIIFDGLDNFNSRYALDKIAHQNGVPMVHAGINSWYGQITTIIPGQTPHLKDIFNKGPEPQEEIPVLSPVVAVIASLQVIEGLKVYLDYEDILANKLLIFDTTDYTINKINL